MTQNQLAYGGAGNVITSEAALAYDPTFNVLTAGAYKLNTTFGLSSDGSGLLTLNNIFSTEDLSVNLGVGDTTRATWSSTTGITNWDFGAISPNYVAAQKDTPTAMGALVVNINKALNTKTDSTSRVISFTGTAVQGQYWGLQWTNTGAGPATISWAEDIYDANTGELVNNITVPAASGGNPGRRHVMFGSDGTDYILYQGGSGSGSGFPLTADADFAVEA